MTTLYGSMVVFNEASRFLESAIRSVLDIVDDLFVWDDQSTDESAQIARDLGAQVVVRPDSVPSFLMHEGQMREAAWRSFETTMTPRPGSWVFSVDADECLVTTGSECVRCEINQAIQAAESIQAKSVIIPVPEVFGFSDGVPLVRTDGFWGTVAGGRLFKYEPNGRFADKPMGSGSEPTYTQGAPFSRQSFGLSLLHYGYSRREDQIVKHARYSSLLAHGHNDSHIASIVTPPTLKRWEGPVPKMLRGDEYPLVA